MTQQVTIRRTATKRIEALLKQAIVISRVFKDHSDGHGESWSSTPAEVMGVGQRIGFQRVSCQLDSEGEWETLDLVVHSAYLFRAYRSQEVAKRLMTNASWAHHFPDAYQAEQEVERQEALKARKAYVARRNRWHSKRITSAAQVVLQVSQRIRAVFAVVNKRCSLADYIGDCQGEEFGEPEWDQRSLSYVRRPNWRWEQCEVERVVELDQAAYDEVATSMLEDRPSLFQGMGGTRSDWRGPAGVEVDPCQLEGVDKEEWIAKSFRLVVVITAPGRLTYVVDPQGYMNARYVGLQPTLLTDR